MAAHGSRRLLGMTENATAVVGIELLAAAQGCDFHLPLESSKPLQAVRSCVRSKVPHIEDDQYFYPYLEDAIGLIRSGAVTRAASDVLLPSICERTA